VALVFLFNRQTLKLKPKTKLYRNNWWTNAKYYFSLLLYRKFQTSVHCISIRSFLQLLAWVSVILAVTVINFYVSILYDNRNRAGQVTFWDTKLQKEKMMGKPTKKEMITYTYKVTHQVEASPERETGSASVVISQNMTVNDPSVCVASAVVQVHFWMSSVISMIQFSI